MTAAVISPQLQLYDGANLTGGHVLTATTSGRHDGYRFTTAVTLGWLRHYDSYNVTKGSQSLGSVIIIWVDRGLWGPSVTETSIYVA